MADTLKPQSPNAANHTENFQLSQFAGTDTPKWTQDYNADMNRISLMTAPKAHSSTGMEFGAASATQYGHVRLGIDDVTKDSPESALIFKICHPVNSILETTSNRNPASYYQLTTSTLTSYAGACGTWESYGAGQVLVGQGSFSDHNGLQRSFSVGEAQTGVYKHTLIADEMPKHNHACLTNDLGQTLTAKYGSTQVGTGGVDVNSGNAQYEYKTNFAGSGQSHENMPPYIVVYRWRRIA